MSQFAVALFYWLHAFATVVFVGHYVLLSLIYLPVLAKQALTSITGTALSQISKRSRPWLYISLLIFLVTGTYLTLTDTNYLGFANFGNFWVVLMLIKHLLILGMIAMGFWFNAILRVGPMMSSNTGAIQGMAHFRWYSNAMAISGVLVLLLTALAQIE